MQYFPAINFPSQTLIISNESKFKTIITNTNRPKLLLKDFEVGLIRRDMLKVKENCSLGSWTKERVNVQEKSFQN